MSVDLQNMPSRACIGYLGLHCFVNALSARHLQKMPLRALKGVFSSKMFLNFEHRWDKAQFMFLTSLLWELRQSDTVSYHRYRNIINEFSQNVAKFLSSHMGIDVSWFPVSFWLVSISQRILKFDVSYYENSCWQWSWSYDCREEKPRRTLSLSLLQSRNCKESGRWFARSKSRRGITGSWGRWYFSIWMS